MRFKFNFHQVDHSQALEIYTEEEILKVGRFLLKDSTCNIFYRKGRYECHAQVDVNSPWGHFKATASANNFYAAVNEVAEKLGRQFQKHKEKHQNHKKFDRSKRGKVRRLNAQLEYDNTPFQQRKAG